jgi:site-specific DNA-methyltransferase (adenine-specific)
MPTKKPTLAPRITLVKLADITPYENNPRNNDAAVKLVVASIKEFGFRVPLVLDSNRVIVCGHTRYKAAQEMGLNSVPCIIADDLTPAQVKAYRLADNRVGESTEWNMDQLAEEVAGCIPDFDMTDFGFAEIGDTVPDVAEEYKEMPECENENQLGIHITVYFKTEKDKLDFGSKIGQELRPRQSSTWFPAKDAK